MDIAVIGGGGREHAIIKKLKQSPDVEKIYALPGNGGIAEDAVCVDIAATDIDKIVDFALKNNIGFAVVSPDNPLVAGAVDALEKAGIHCFGPDKSAAQIEGSKVFAKNLMKKYGIPTAKYEVFDDAADALKYLEGAKMPAVIKADGLALGKGVIIAQNSDEARKAVIDIMENKKFGSSGDSVVIEEFLTGPEVSVLAFTDGANIAPMLSSMDHKRALDNDEGLNTGGMGAVAPNPYYTSEIARRCTDEIFMPTIRAMQAEGRRFKGCLYFGLMLTQDGPKVIEYNCRFGDPEAQAVLPLLKSDLFAIMQSCREETLADTPAEFEDGASCCVVMASSGYPENYEKGFEINISPEMDAQVCISGARLDDGALYTDGGRVLCVTAVAQNLGAAVEKAYSQVNKVSFENAYYRKDIGKRALGAKDGY